MMKKRTYLAIAILAAALLPMGAHAAAQQRQPAWHKAQNVQTHSNFSPPRSQFVQNRARKISSSRAKSIAMSRNPGAEYVNVQLVRGDTYRVRLKKNGRIIDVYVDAYTGRVKN